MGTCLKENGILRVYRILHLVVRILRVVLFVCVQVLHHHVQDGTGVGDGHLQQQNVKFLHTVKILTNMCRSSTCTANYCYTGW